MNENLNNIDQRLEAQSQRAVAQLVASLPDETPSMVWRSGLNQALLTQSTRQRRRQRFFLIARPALGLMAACALAVVVLVKPARIESTPRTSPSIASSAPLEASLLNVHRDDQRAMDVAGVGLDPNETTVEAASDNSRTTSAPADDSEADLEL